GRAACFELLRFDVLDDRNGPLLDVFDLLLELLPLRDLRLELLREVGRLLDVPDRIESAGAEVRELPVQRRAHRLEFRAQAVDLEAFRPQIPELVVRDLVRRSPGLRAAGDCRPANPFLDGVILAPEPLPVGFTAIRPVPPIASFARPTPLNRFASLPCERVYNRKVASIIRQSSARLRAGISAWPRAGIVFIRSDGSDGLERISEQGQAVG